MSSALIGVKFLDSDVLQKLMPPKLLAILLALATSASAETIAAVAEPMTILRAVELLREYTRVQFVGSHNQIESHFKGAPPPQQLLIRPDHIFKWLEFLSAVNPSFQQWKVDRERSV